MIKNLSRKRGVIAGFALLEMSLSLLIFSAVMMVRMRADFNDLMDLRAKNAAKVMLIVQNSVNDTLASYYDNFVNMPDGAGVAPLTIVIGSGPTQSNVVIADGYHPTIADLVSLGKLPGNFSLKSPVGGNFKISVTKSPVGCVIPNCNLEAQIVIDSPFLINGKYDEKRMGLAIRTIGADGAGTRKESTSTIYGLNGQWSEPLSASITPAAGILATRAGYSSAAWAPFFRIDGTRWMTQDGNFGGHALVNVKHVISTLKNIDDACDVTDNGALGSGVINGNGMAMVCRNGKWKPQTGLVGNVGGACAPDGSIATDSSTGEQLVCKGGKYIRLISLIAKNVEVSRTIVKDGDTVSKPVCDVGGIADYSFDMIQMSVDITKNPPYQGQYVSSADNGASWTVLLKLVTDTGTETSGNAYGVKALMHLECRY
jgi:hypothetical protein